MYAAEKKNYVNMEFRTLKEMLFSNFYKIKYPLRGNFMDCYR